MNEHFIEVKEKLIDMYNFNKDIKVELTPCGVKPILDYIDSKDKEIERLKKDLKTLWNVCWNNDTEMTSYQKEIFDNYYDEFHKLNGGDK